MKREGKRVLFLGAISMVAFIIWTILIQTVDVQPCGVKGTDIGFATINQWFHQFSGVHMNLWPFAISCE